MAHLPAQPCPRPSSPPSTGGDLLLPSPWGWGRLCELPGQPHRGGGGRAPSWRAGGRVGSEPGGEELGRGARGRAGGRRRQQRSPSCRALGARPGGVPGQRGPELAGSQCSPGGSSGGRRAGSRAGAPASVRTCRPQGVSAGRRVPPGRGRRHLAQPGPPGPTGAPGGGAPHPARCRGTASLRLRTAGAGAGQRVLGDLSRQGGPLG